MSKFSYLQSNFGSNPFWVLVVVPKNTTQKIQEIYYWRCAYILPTLFYLINADGTSFIWLLLYKHNFSVYNILQFHFEFYFVHLFFLFLFNGLSYKLIFVLSFCAPQVFTWHSPWSMRCVSFAMLKCIYKIIMKWRQAIFLNSWLRV